jgi:hypothetical protein
MVTDAAEARAAMNKMAVIEGDVWRQEYDRSNEPKRGPGLIELNRYVVNSGAYSGISTFLN